MLEFVISKNEVGEKLVDPKSEEKFGENQIVFLNLYKMLLMQKLKIKFP